MFRLYLLKGWRDSLYLMSASKIHKKVMDKSKESDYDWIAPATDLISLCEKNSFPINYEIDIKVAILNCFSRLINSDNDATRRKETDLDAVYCAYNSLYGIKEEKVIDARYNFLQAFLKNVSGFKYVYLGEKYYEFLCKWRDLKFNELKDQEYINFPYLKTILHEEFLKDYYELKEKNLFKNDIKGVNFVECDEKIKVKKKERVL